MLCVDASLAWTRRWRSVTTEGHQIRLLRLRNLLLPRLRRPLRTMFMLVTWTATGKAILTAEAPLVWVIGGLFGLVSTATVTCL